VKIVFLDFDGVLVNRETLASGFPGYGHPDCVAALNLILASTRAHIVVSSTWRMDGLDAVREHLERWGVRGPVVDITPRQFTSRGREIEAWLKDNPGIKDFVILDDDSDMDPYMDRLVQTKFNPGLTMRDAIRAIALLDE
jgi:hypothetical protein